MRATLYSVHHIKAFPIVLLEDTSDTQFVGAGSYFFCNEVLLLYDAMLAHNAASAGSGLIFKLH